jgi:hypothetical protein
MFLICSSYEEQPMSVVESYSSLSAFKAGPAVGTACIVGANDIPDGAFFFTPGDFSGQPADDQESRQTLPRSMPHW